MKTEVLNKKKEFEPIKLKITIESEQEFCDLWHRLNESAHVLNKNITNDSLKHKCDANYQLFFKLDEIAKEYNLYK